MNLTDEEIRIKVAEAMGWHEEKEPVGSANASAWWHNNDRYPSYLMPVPNYPADLNACAEFEATLTYEEAETYEDELCDICKRDNDLADNPAPWRFAVATANPTQRCIAYLKTKGLIP